MMDRETVETCRVLIQNKFEILVRLVGLIIRIFHDTRSSECQIHFLGFDIRISEILFHLGYCGESLGEYCPNF